MAIAQETQKQTDEVLDILVKVKPIYRQFETTLSEVKKLSAMLTSFDTNLKVLVNAQEALERNKNALIAESAKIEKAAKERLATMEHGHRTLVDNLSKKQIEADAAKADAEATKRKADESRAQSEAVIAAYEQKLAELTAARPEKNHKKQ